MHTQAHTFKHTQSLTQSHTQTHSIFTNGITSLEPSVAGPKSSPFTITCWSTDGRQCRSNWINRQAKSLFVITFTFLLSAYRRASKPVRSVLSGFRFLLDSCYETSVMERIARCGIAHSVWDRTAVGVTACLCALTFTNLRVPLLLTLGTVIARIDCAVLWVSHRPFYRVPGAGRVIAQKVFTSWDIHWQVPANMCEQWQFERVTRNSVLVGCDDASVGLFRHFEGSTEHLAKHSRTAEHLARHSRLAIHNTL